jgi:hypothetical protein
MMVRAVLAAPRIMSAVFAFWRSMSQQFSDGYRPELHYMRGPGPKWRAKHPPTG